MENKKTAMTPKETASHLFKRYEVHLATSFNPDTGVWDFKFNSKETIKECALIAVDEIINSIEEDYNYLIPYWQAVELEIEKL